MNQPGHHPAGAAFAGAAATVFHDAVMTPMDVVKQRVQLGYHKGMLDCMLTIGRTEGTQVGAGDTLYVRACVTCVHVVPVPIAPTGRSMGDFDACVWLLLVLPTRSPSAPPPAKFRKHAQTSASLSPSFRPSLRPRFPSLLLPPSLPAARRQNQTRRSTEAFRRRSS